MWFFFKFTLRLYFSQVVDTFWHTIQFPLIFLIRMPQFLIAINQLELDNTNMWSWPCHWWLRKWLAVYWAGRGWLPYWVQSSTGGHTSNGMWPYLDQGLYHQFCLKHLFIIKNSVPPPVYTSGASRYNGYSCDVDATFRTIQIVMGCQMSEWMIIFNGLSGDRDSEVHIVHLSQWPLLLTWINFNHSIIPF